MSLPTPRVTGYQLAVHGTLPDGTLWGPRETPKFAPPDARISGLATGRAVFRARRDALATRAAMLQALPGAEVFIAELTTADLPGSAFPLDLIPDADGVLCTRRMMEARALRSPRLAELLENGLAAATERELRRQAMEVDQ